MPRSAVRSRADKSRSESVVMSSVPLVKPAEPQPGNTPNSSCINMITQAEGEEVVMDIMEELMEAVMDRCGQLEVQTQEIPYSVRWVQNNLVQTLQCLFLMRDEGDDLEHIWKEDPEPEPCAVDSWAEGCVPVVHTKHNN